MRVRDHLLEQLTGALQSFGLHGVRQKLTLTVLVALIGQILSDNYVCQSLVHLEPGFALKCPVFDTQPGQFHPQEFGFKLVSDH